jgi:hypothetical protein
MNQAANLPVACGGTELAFVTMGGAILSGRPTRYSRGESTGPPHGARKISTAFHFDKMGRHEAWLEGCESHGRTPVQFRCNGLDASIIEATPSFARNHRGLPGFED